MGRAHPRLRHANEGPAELPARRHPARTQHRRAAPRPRPPERARCGARSAGAPDPVLDAVLLHCLAHVTAAASTIKRNGERLKAGGRDAAAEAPRDQGFTRPKARPALRGGPALDTPLACLHRCRCPQQRRAEGPAF